MENSSELWRNQSLIDLFLADRDFYDVLHCNIVAKVNIPHNHLS